MTKPAAVFTALMILVLTLTGCTGSASEQLPKALSLYLTEQKRIITVTREDYIAGCILAVADPSFQPAALEAVGIACFTQALYCSENSRGMEFMGADVSDDSAVCPAWTSPSQALDECDEKYAQRVLEAAGNAAGKYLEYEAAPAFTPVFRASSGITDDGGLPYLPSLELPEDPDSPWYSASCTVSAEYTRKALRQYTGSVILPPQEADWFSDAEYTPAGTLLTIRFGGAVITGEQLRDAFMLRSCAISIHGSGDEFTLTSRGSGGNIGMSAYSAERLARSGKSAEEILDFFFPGTSLRELPQNNFNKRC